VAQIPTGTPSESALTSRKVKKRKDSSERTADNADFRSADHETSFLTRCSMLFHDRKMEMGVRIVVKYDGNKLIQSNTQVVIDRRLVDP